MYLLNMVDEADLLTLMEEAPTEPQECSCIDKCELGGINADCTICSTDKNGCTGKLAEPTEPTEPQQENEGNPAGLLILLLIVGLIGGGAFYYFKILKNKPNTKANPHINEYDFDEDDEDEYDFENTEDTQDEQENTDESEDDTK